MQHHEQDGSAPSYAISEHSIDDVAYVLEQL